MKIAILGTRGIPNYHGGFEQFAEFFSIFLQQKEIDAYEKAGIALPGFYLIYTDDGSYVNTADTPEEATAQIEEYANKIQD